MKFDIVNGYGVRNSSGVSHVTVPLCFYVRLTFSSLKVVKSLINLASIGDICQFC
jgi:hypothetical protein